MKIVDAFGMQCPKPLMLAKKELDAGCREFAVQVDNETAVKNLTRLAQKSNLDLSVAEVEGGWLVSFSESSEHVVQTADHTEHTDTKLNPNATVSNACSTRGGCGYAVFIGKDHVGEGEGELGYNLMKMALYTLSECGDAPASLLFMNSGVSLVAGREQQITDSVNNLIQQGTEVLVCGTCLDFYGLKDSLAVGEVSNMYDILERMREASHVITL